MVGKLSEGVVHKEGKNSQPRLRIVSLKKQTVFDLVNKNGKKSHGRFFILIGMRGDLGAPDTVVHLGLKISKKMGCAVIRNKVRRRLKSLLRSSLKEIDIRKWTGWTFVFVPRKGLENVEYKLLEFDMLQFLRRAVETNNEVLKQCSV